MCCGIIINIEDCQIQVIESDNTSFTFNSIVDVGKDYVILKNGISVRRIVSSELLKPKGDLKQFFEKFLKDCQGCCNKEHLTEQLIITDDNLPTVFEDCTSLVFIDMNLTQDIDISSWEPVGLCEGAIVRIRKNSKDSNIVKWRDYTFLNKQGELITFVWAGNTFNII